MGPYLGKPRCQATIDPTFSFIFGIGCLVFQAYMCIDTQKEHCHPCRASSNRVVDMKIFAYLAALALPLTIDAASCRSVANVRP